MFDNMKINDFLTELSSNSPAPGGGSVAAFSSALASALGAMVGNLTIGKKSYREMEEEKKSKVDEALEACIGIRETYMNLMEEDTKSFMEVIDAFKLPKNTDEELVKRNEAIERGYKTALATPKRLCDEALKLYPYLNELALYGNVNAISDVGVAVLLNSSSIESAMLNIIINLKNIKDEAFAVQIRGYLDEVSLKNNNFKNDIMNIVNKRL